MVGPLATRAAVGWQQRGDLGPGLISELVATDHPSSLADSRSTRQTYQAAFVRHALVSPNLRWSVARRRNSSAKPRHGLLGLRNPSLLEPSLGQREPDPCPKALRSERISATFVMALRGRKSSMNSSTTIGLQRNGSLSPQSHRASRQCATIAAAPPGWGEPKGEELLGQEMWRSCCLSSP
jgi:hypothetical protein